jgi:hypothetical protein
LGLGASFRGAGLGFGLVAAFETGFVWRNAVAGLGSDDGADILAVGVVVAGTEEAEAAPAAATVFTGTLTAGGPETRPTAALMPKSATVPPTAMPASVRTILVVDGPDLDGMWAFRERS